MSDAIRGLCLSVENESRLLELGEYIVSIMSLSIKLQEKRVKHPLPKFNWGLTMGHAMLRSLHITISLIPRLRELSEIISATVSHETLASHGRSNGLNDERTYKD
jgi:hypothetical protein